MSAPDIGAELGLTRQTVHRFIQQLEEVRLVRRDIERERYDVGPALTELGWLALTNSQYARQRRVVMERLVARVSETSNLGVFDGYEVVYVDRVECDWPLRMQIVVGGRMPAYCTAIGKLLLAHLSERRLDTYLAQSPLHRLTPNTICDPDAFREEMAMIRERGYSINNQEDIEGLLGVAAPVRDGEGAVIAGLSLHGPTVRLSQDRARSLVPDLIEAARAIGEMMNESA